MKASFVGVFAVLGLFASPVGATTYTWNSTVTSGNWTDAANWLVDGAATTGHPSSSTADQAVFGSAATVTLDADTWSSNVTFNADVTLTGGKSLYAREIAGTGTITMSNAYIRNVAGASLDFSNNIVLAADTANGILPTSTINYRGNLSGSGALSVANGAAYVGVQFFGDNSAYSGTLTAGGTNRNNFRIMTVSAAGSNATWNCNSSTASGSSGFDMFGVTGTYYFGALNGYVRLTSVYSVTIETGHLNTDCAANVAPVNDARNTTVRKVGTGRLTLTSNGGLPYLQILGGEVSLVSYGPTKSITFLGAGGTLSLASALTYDPSAKIVSSTAPIAFDDGGVDRTWATALAASNVGGFTKKGTGTLTLGAKPLYTGDTTIGAGTLVLPNEATGIAFAGLAVSNNAALSFTAAPATWTNGAVVTLCTFTSAPAGQVFDSSDIRVTGLGSRAQYTLSTNLDETAGVTAINATISNESLVWNGADGDDWLGTEKWLGRAGGAALTFASGDVVWFTEGAFGAERTSGTNAVVISAAVDPKAVVAAVPAGYGYRLTGSAITGDGSLAKTGAGDLILANALNTFSGGATISEGAIVLESASLQDGIENDSALRVNAAGQAITLGAITGTGTNFVDAGDVTFGTCADTVRTVVGSGASTFPAGIANCADSITVAEGAVARITTKAVTYGRNNNPVATPTYAGAGMIAYSNVSFNASGIQWGSAIADFTGAIRVESGATYYPPQYGSDATGNANFLGTSSRFEFAGGSVVTSWRMANDIWAYDKTLPAGLEIRICDGTTSSWQKLAIYGDGTSRGRLFVKSPFTGGGTLYLSNTYGFMLQNDNSGFTGSIVFTNSQASASGFYAASAGSASASWTVASFTGSGDSAVPSPVYFAHGSTDPLRFGSLDVNAASAIYVTSAGAPVEIGALGKDCAIEGYFTNQAVSVTKVGAATLTLGGGFAAPEGSSVVVSNGTLAVNATNTFLGVISVAPGAVLSGAFTTRSLACASGAVITNTPVDGAAAPIVSHNAVDVSGVVIKFSAPLDRSGTYRVLTAPGITGTATVDAASAGSDRWIMAIVTNEDGTKTLVARYTNGFILRIADGSIRMPDALCAAYMPHG